MQPPRASDKVAEAVKGRFQTLDRLPIPVDVLSVGLVRMPSGLVGSFAGNGPRTAVDARSGKGQQEE
jgi:hypothetical protein